MLDRIPRLSQWQIVEAKLTPKIRLICEKHPNALSASVGVFFRCGSRNEEARFSGFAHIAEHIFFKGTTSLSADEISYKFERCGGELNAFTEREFTCFHATVPADELSLSFEVLFEMLFDSVFDEDEFYKEKNVIMQELKGYEENPEDEFWDSLLEIYWPDHPLGRRIGNISKKIKGVTFPNVIRFIQNVFLNSEICIVVASPFEAGLIEEQLKRELDRARKYLWGDFLDREPTPTIKAKKFRVNSRNPVLKKFDSDQVHFALVYPGVPFDHPEEIVYSSVALLLGGGSSSLLYQKVREESGLAYYVSFANNAFSDNGLMIGNVSSEPKSWEQALVKSYEACAEIAKGIDAEDVDFLQRVLRGSLLLNSESTSSRMEVLGRQFMTMGRVMSLAESAKEIDLVTLESLNRVAKIFEQKPFLYAFGPV